MAESFISLLPSQSPAKSLPYETLWRAVYENLDDKGKQKFGGSNVLDQTRFILGALNSDQGIEILKSAIENANAPAVKNNTKIRADIDRLTQNDLNMLREGARQSLVQRAQALSTMSAKALDAQKIKETMGAGNLTDEEYLDWLENKPLVRTGMDDKTIPWGERYSIPEKMDAQADYNRKLMRAPENLEGDYNQSGFDYLINKKRYYSPDNKIERGIDKALSVVPILPFASQGAIARQQGEIAPDETGLLNGGTFVGGSLNTLALPAMYLPGGAAIAGGLAALGNSIAKGKKGDDLATVIDWMADTGIGAGTGQAGKFVAGKIPGVKNLDPKASAQKEVEKAESAYRDLMRPMLNGQKLREGEAEAIEHAADMEYTNRINQAIQSGQVSGVDANAFDPNRAGGKYIVIPSEVWKNEAKLKETDAAIEAAKRRTEMLKGFNKYQNVDRNTGAWMDSKLDEGGYNPAIQKARQVYKNLFGREINDNAPVDFSNITTPTETVEMVASKPIYPFGNEAPKTYAQSVLKALGYDKAGKGAQQSATTAPQFDVNMKIRQSAATPELGKFIDLNYGGSPKAMARDIVDEADSYVQEAFNLKRNGNLSPERFKALADEYVSWNAADPSQADYYTREFIAKFNQLVRNPEKTPFVRKPYTNIPAQLNQGGDLKGMAGVERPNPALAAQGDAETMLESFATDIAKKNGRTVPNKDDWGQALAYYGDLENPSQNAVDKAISRADAWKNKLVMEEFNKMKASYNIPSAEAAAKAEEDIIKAKANVADAGKFVNPFSKKAQLNKLNLLGLVNPKVRPEILSKPEQATFDEERANETLPQTNWLIGKLPSLKNFLYLDEAKKRGNYVPESNLNYTIPDILKAR